MDLKELKMFRMKSHDCYEFMERLIPISFREMLSQKVWSVLDFSIVTYLPKDKRGHMRQSEQSVLILMCKVERIFPSRLFDVLEHLILHLLYKTGVCVLVHYRWMYHFER